MALSERDKELRMTALTRLALATREKVATPTYVLFLEDTAGFSTAVVVDACRRLETSSAWFPKLAELVDECRIVAQRYQERADERARKKLPPAPVSPEKLQDFMAQLRKFTRKKAMR